jgi:hypothetical protein
VLRPPNRINKTTEILTFAENKTEVKKEIEETELYKFMQNKPRERTREAATIGRRNNDNTNNRLNCFTKNRSET